jgi:hypothetical protein
VTEELIKLVVLGTFILAAVILVFSVDRQGDDEPNDEPHIIDEDELE